MKINLLWIWEIWCYHWDDLLRNLHQKKWFLVPSMKKGFHGFPADVLQIFPGFNSSGKIWIMSGSYLYGLLVKNEHETTDQKLHLWWSVTFLVGGNCGSSRNSHDHDPPWPCLCPTMHWPFHLRWWETPAFSLHLKCWCGAHAEQMTCWYGGQNGGPP